MACCVVHLAVGRKLHWLSCEKPLSPSVTWWPLARTEDLQNRSRYQDAFGETNLISSRKVWEVSALLALREGEMKPLSLTDAIELTPIMSTRLNESSRTARPNHDVDRYRSHPVAARRSTSTS